MSIKTTEVGKKLNYGTYFDLSSATELALKFTSPAGVETTLTMTGGRVSAPSVAVSDSVIGEFAADNYMQITTIATDFTEAGTWKVCGTYTDATPKVFHGDEGEFEVGESC